MRSMKVNYFPGRMLSRAGIAPVRLEAKEGLALTNGVQMTAAVLPWRYIRDTPGKGG